MNPPPLWKNPHLLSQGFSTHTCALSQGVHPPYYPYAKDRVPTEEEEMKEMRELQVGLRNPSRPSDWSTLYD